MKTIQFVPDEKMRRTADHAANEERDRAGYEKSPQAKDESLRWEREAVWLEG